MFQAGAEYCFALADGLGGHGKGEVASRIAVEQAVAAFAEAGKASEEVIRTAFGNAQDATADTMNSGLVAIRGSAGDALAYGMRGGRV